VSIEDNPLIDPHGVVGVFFGNGPIVHRNAIVQRKAGDIVIGESPSGAWCTATRRRSFFARR